jgi:AcrR family transcriptional regulator
VTRRSAQKQATRERLYATALRLFERDGYAAVSVEDIVRACGVARGTFYFHYPDKEDVLYEAVRRGQDEIAAGMAAAGARGGLRAVLAETCAGFARLWGGRQRRALLADAGALGMRRIAGEARARDEEPLRLELSKHVARAQAAGELRSVLPAQILADVFLLDVFAALMVWAQRGTPPLSVVMPGVVELFLRGAEAV